MTEASDSSALVCANCEAPLQFDVTYPVVTQKQNGDIEYYSFCDDDCRAAWNAAR